MVTVRYRGGWLWIEAGKLVLGVWKVPVFIMRQTGLSHRKVSLCKGPVAGMGEIELGAADLRSERKPWV